MHDVLRSLFETKFIQELFKPQEIYPVALTRKIFEKLAHSSIMRLSESRWVTGSPALHYAVCTMPFNSLQWPWAC